MSPRSMAVSRVASGSAGTSTLTELLAGTEPVLVPGLDLVLVLCPGFQVLVGVCLPRSSGVVHQDAQVVAGVLPVAAEDLVAGY